MRNAGTFALSLWQDCRREIFAWNSHICSPPAWLVAFLLLSGTLSFALPQVGYVHCSTSGLYTFRAQGGTSGGAWSEPGVAALRIQILPPWWGTWWFRGLSAAICLTLLWAGYRIRVGTLHERHRVLEREQQILRRHEREISALNERLMKAHEEERMRIAGDLHDGVLQQLDVNALSVNRTVLQMVGRPFRSNYRVAEQLDLRRLDLFENEECIPSPRALVKISL